MARGNESNENLAFFTEDSWLYLNLCNHDMSVTFPVTKERMGKRGTVCREGWSAPGTVALGSHRQKGMTLRPPWTTQRAESQSRLHIEILPQEKRNGSTLSVSKHETSCPQSSLDHFSLILVARLCHPKPITGTTPVFHSESTSYRLITLPLP